MRKRIADLEIHAEKEYEGWKFDGGRVEINKGVNRVQIFFEGKPDENVRSELKSNGFKWAPSQGAWQRQLTDNAMYALKRISSIQKKGESCGI